MVGIFVQKKSLEGGSMDHEETLLQRLHGKVLCVDETKVPVKLLSCANRDAVRHMTTNRQTEVCPEEGRNGGFSMLIYGRSVSTVAVK